MTWKQARIIAAGHIKRINLPRRLDGVTVLMADYADEDTLRFLKSEEPDLTLQSQSLLNRAFARECVKRGARVRFVPVNIGDYFGWIGKYHLPNTAGNRAQFVSWLTCPEPKFTPNNHGLAPDKI